MSLRKGQHLFNELSKRYDLGDHYEDLHRKLFYMDDKEFDEIIQSTPKFDITYSKQKERTEN